MGWGLASVSLPRLEVTVVAKATPRRRPGLLVEASARRRIPLRSAPATACGVSSIPRLLIEVAAAGATTDELHELIEKAVRRNLLDIPDLAATLERNAGRAGTRKVTQTCEEYLPHLDRKSALERAFDRWLLKHPEIPPRSATSISGPGRSTATGLSTGSRSNSTAVPTTRSSRTSSATGVRTPGCRPAANASCASPTAASSATSPASIGT